MPVPLVARGKRPIKMTEALENILKSFNISAPSSIQLFKDNATLKTWQKNADIFGEGKKNSSEYILLSGIVHRYNISDKGDRVTTGFYLPPSVITPHFARTGNGKSLYCLQAATEAVLAEIPVAKLDHLRSVNKEFYDFGQRVVEKELSLSVRLEVAYRSLGAKERLLAMRKHYPNLENLVPHHIIASYLGITQVSFSRLRKELSRK